METLYTQLILDEYGGDGGVTRGPYVYYIFRDGDYNILVPRINSRYISLLYILRELARKYPRKEDLPNITSNYTFENLYRYLVERIEEDIKSYEEAALLDEEAHDLAILTFWECIGLSRVAPFLYPDFIEEIYCDGPGTRIYVRHVELGTMDTDIYLTGRELEALINHIEMHKGTSIDLVKGNIESEIRTDDFHCRVIIDFEPLAYRGPYIIIRNLGGRRLSIIDLINNDTISIEAAAFLILALWLRRNVTIAGEVYSGKTTLLNALDQCIPRRFRRVYIEDALESLDMRGQGFKQAFYRAETYSNILEKRRQLIFTLHRTPDILILGELLTNEDIKTFFYSLSCGLRGLQTIHAEDIYSLINRWRYQANINIELINETDLIVIMKRTPDGKRHVEGIYETYIRDGLLRIRPIFSRIDDKLQMNIDINNTKIYQKMVNIIGQSKLTRLYQSILEALNKEDIVQTVDSLNEIYRVVVERG